MGTGGPGTLGTGVTVTGCFGGTNGGGWGTRGVPWISEEKGVILRRNLLFLFVCLEDPSTLSR